MASASSTSTIAQHPQPPARPRTPPQNSHKSLPFLQRIRRGTDADRTPSGLLRQLTRSSSSSPWPDPGASIGRQIDTGTKKMGRSKVWLAVGPAHDVFDTKLRPELEVKITNSGLTGRAPLFLRDYMIGPTEGQARPYIMVCCVDPKMRVEAHQCVRDTGLAKDHGFELGSSALALEAKKPVIKTMLRSSPDVLALHQLSCTVGRRLVFPDYEDHAATGGVLIRVGNHIHQLTVAHVAETHEEEWDIDTDVDLDEVSLEFDDFSDTGDNDYAMTSHGSLTPGSYSDTEDPDTSNSDLTSLWSDRAAKSFSGHLAGVQESSSEIPAPGSSETSPARVGEETEPPMSRPAPTPAPETSRKVLVDEISSLAPPDSTLDYLLFAINPRSDDFEAIGRHGNLVIVPPTKTGIETLSGDSKQLTIEEEAEIPTEESNVFAITASGPLSGTLSPGATSYLRPGTSTFLKVYVINIDGVVSKGDCGAAVIDVTTGKLYGHVVLGAPGTSLAYIVSAKAVLESIRDKTKKDVSLDIKRKLAPYRSSAPESPRQANRQVIVASKTRPSSVLMSGAPRGREYAYERWNRDRFEQVPSDRNLDLTGEPITGSNSGCSSDEELRRRRRSQIEIRPYFEDDLRSFGLEAPERHQRYPPTSFRFGYVGPSAHSVANAERDQLRFPPPPPSHFYPPPVPLMYPPPLYPPIPPQAQRQDRSSDGPGVRIAVGDVIIHADGRSTTVTNANRLSNRSSHRSSARSDYSSVYSRESVSTGSTRGSVFDYDDSVVVSRRSVVTPRSSVESLADPGDLLRETGAVHDDDIEVLVGTQAPSEVPSRPAFTPYERPRTLKVLCPFCNDRPEGFRGSHELQRHINSRHPERTANSKRWVCRDPEAAGININDEPITGFTSCTACVSGAKYYEEKALAAHLKLVHFPYQPYPPLSELRKWIVEIDVSSAGEDNDTSRLQAEVHASDKLPTVEFEREPALPLRRTVTSAGSWEG